MDIPNDIDSNDATEEDLNRIIMMTCQSYLRAIDTFLPLNNVLNHNDRRRDLKNLFDFSHINFKKLKKLLLYGKETINDAEKVQNLHDQIKSIFEERHKTSQNVDSLITDGVLLSKLPTINPEVTSYLLNQGSYDLLQLSIKGVSGFDNLTEQVHETMNKIIQKKLCLSKLPEEELVFDIKEGVLSATAPSFSFELTLFYDQKKEDYNWFLLLFEHKLERFANIEKKIERLNNEISKLYVENKREHEIYIIMFIVYKIKYFYTRKKLKSIIKKAEILRTQLEQIGSEEVFDINQKVISKDGIFFEVCYWKNSLLHSLMPNHRFNCLTFQLPHYDIFHFIEKYMINPFDLFAGLSQNEVTCVYHEPCLFTSETINQVHNLMVKNQLPQTIKSYAKISQMLLFQVSKKVKLRGLTLENDFFEIFNEVKAIFQSYQLLHYFCILYKKLQPRDLENIYLYSKSTKLDNKPDRSAPQNNIFIGIEVEKKILSVSVDSTNGSVDFNFEFLDRDVEIYRSKFKHILCQDPLQFPQVLILYKKLLLLSASNKFLLANSAKFYPERGKNDDNFKAVTYQSYGVHFTRQDGNFRPVKIIFSHRIEFDQAFEVANVRTDVQFSYFDAQTSDQASLVHISSINLVPFDLKRITQEFGDLLTNKRCMAYYGFEINRLESLNGRNSGVSFNDTQKFLLKVSPNLEQNLSTIDNTVVITIKPPFPLSDRYSSYINAHEGLKLVFPTFPLTAQKPKAYEIYEMNKLTFKYSTVLDAYTYMQKDIERLENHVKQLGFGKEEDMEVEKSVMELHSFGLYNIGNMVLRFYNDRIIDIQPSRYMFLKLYLEGATRDEKERDFLKKLFVKEIRQGLMLLEFGAELGEKKIEWIPPGIKAKLGQDGQPEKENQAEIEKEKEKNMNVLRTINSYFINLLMLDPWHYILYWKNLTDFNGLNFFLSFQLLSETEHECFAITFEGLTFPDKLKVDEKSPYYPPIQKIFKRFSPQHQAMMNGLSSANGDSQDSGGLRIKISSKGDLIKFVAQLTLLFDYMEKMMRKNIADKIAASMNNANNN